MYASKRRQRNFKRVREPQRQSGTSNPSKRHRERLNGEIETVACLLPYDAATISRLDKLSILRLAVAYLQVKAHFTACVHSSCGFPAPVLPLLFTHAYQFMPTPNPFSGHIPTLVDSASGIPLIDSDERFFESISMKALGGFVLALNNEGEVFYVSENVESFLGFHQSDLLHQPLFELIHSEDREDIRMQLDPGYGMPAGCSTVQDLLGTDNLHCLERSVNARFRCLLDNTCGFLRMDMRGKLLSLHGLPSSFLGARPQSALLGLVAICTPFVPPNNGELPSEDTILKSKHQLDCTLISMDPRLHELLELSENELPTPFYSLVHPEDAICLAEAHKEVVKNGSSGLLIYRLSAQKSGRLYYVQSSCRMFFKNGKADSIALTHRILNEVEGTMLLEKRSSLKAKLLSFDDSLLQSPRNLQSAAALPSICVPSTSRESPDEETSRSEATLPFLLRLKKPHPIARHAETEGKAANGQGRPEISEQKAVVLEQTWIPPIQQINPQQPWNEENHQMLPRMPDVMQWTTPEWVTCGGLYTGNFAMPCPPFMPHFPELPSLDNHWQQNEMLIAPSLPHMDDPHMIKPHPFIPYPLGEKVGNLTKAKKR
ncbi:unnamed protein product, partial [Mesorhabditis spiculigera]